MPTLFSSIRKCIQVYDNLATHYIFYIYDSQRINRLIYFSLQNYYTKYKLLIEAYEVSALSSDAGPSYKIKSVLNNSGAQHWTIGVRNCNMLWVENGGGCSNCIAACPFSK